LLPQTPAAKANKLIEWMQAGILTPQQALSMVDHPDIDSVIGDTIAKRANVEKKIAKLMNGATFESCMPHPYMDLELCKEISSSLLNKYEAAGYPDDKLDDLRTFYKTAVQLSDAEKAKAAALAAPPPGAPPMGPPGAGAMPPGPPMPPPPLPPGPPGAPMPPA
jgi:deferrochelatase/peroxidase EfeB